MRMHIVVVLALAGASSACRRMPADSVLRLLTCTTHRGSKQGRGSILWVLVLRIRLVGPFIMHGSL